jgi:hypothetical protein
MAHILGGCGMIPAIEIGWRSSPRTAMDELKDMDRGVFEEQTVERNGNSNSSSDDDVLRAPSMLPTVALSNRALSYMEVL